MELLSTPWQAFSAFTVFAVGFVLVVGFAGKFYLPWWRASLLYCWHTLFSVIYALYVLQDGGDAVMYYTTALNPDVAFSFGTAGVRSITWFFAGLLQLSFLGTFLVFNIFGMFGLLAFDGALQQAVAPKRRLIRLLATLIVLLPSVSFWSAAIGKDAISFMATGFALWAALNLSQRKLLMGAAVLLMLIVRPHMAGLLIIGLSAAFILQPGLPAAQRAIFGAVSLVLAAIMIPFALNYAGLTGTTDIDSLMNYVELRQSHNLQGGGSVNIAEMSLPMQLFTYLFRPLPFEVSSPFQLAAALDNTILLFLFVAGGIAMLKGRKSAVPDSRVFLWVYALAAWVILSMTTANLGISVRQKWMFAPVLIYLLISVMGRVRKPLVAQEAEVAPGPTTPEKQPMPHQFIGGSPV